MAKLIILILFTFFIISAFASIDADSSIDTDSDVEIQNESSGLGRIRYYHARRDLRRCAFPNCGGWWLYLVNTNQDEIYVSSIDGAKFNEEKVEEYIFAGTLSSRNNNGQPRTLNLRTTYRLLPYDGPQTLDIKRYFIYIGHVAYELNTGRRYNINYYTENYSERINLIDEDWLQMKIEGHSVLYGNVINNVLAISLIYIQLPDPQYGCPNFPVYKCTENYVNTFTRDENRCFSSTGCTRSGVCILSIPVCSPNYTLVSARSKPNGCYKYWCDAYYLV